MHQAHWIALIMKTTKALTVSAQLVDHFLSGARAAGLDTERLLRKAEIAPEQLSSPKGRIELEKVVLLQRYCNGVLKDEAAGNLGAPLRPGYFRYMMLSAVHAGNLVAALQRCCEYFNLFENTFHFKMMTQSGQTEFRLEMVNDTPLRTPYAVDFVLSSVHRFLGWLGNHRLILNQVNHTFSPPGYRDEYRYTYYGAPVLFNQPYNSWTLETKYLDQAIVQNEATVEAYMRRAPLDLYLPLDAGGEATEQVRTRIWQGFSNHSLAPSLEDIARDCGLTPQTLRRRLKAEGTLFQTVKGQVRRDIAIHHLGKNEHSIEAIAAKAGYSEPSAFIRAFKIWTGFTPLQFRKALAT